MGGNQNMILCSLNGGIMNEAFRHFASKISKITGSPWAFVTATSIILFWIISGPIFNYSNTWQLMINTTTTVVTFLMVFLIQNTQNRDTKAVHIKLDELLRTVKGARNNLIEVENMSDEELELKHQEFKKLHDKAELILIERRKKRSR